MRATVVSAKNAEPSTQTDAADEPTETLGHTEHGRLSQQKRRRVRSQEAGDRQHAHDACVLRRLVHRVSCELIRDCSVRLRNLSCRRLCFICKLIFVSLLGVQEEGAAGEEYKEGDGRWTRGETRGTRKILRKSCKSILERRLIRGIQTKSLVWILVKRAVCVHEKLFESRRFVHQFAASLCRRVRCQGFKCLRTATTKPQGVCVCYLMFKYARVCVLIDSSVARLLAPSVRKMESYPARPPLLSAPSTSPNPCVSLPQQTDSGEEHLDEQFEILSPGAAFLPGGDLC